MTNAAPTRVLTRVLQLSKSHEFGYLKKRGELMKSCCRLMCLIVGLCLAERAGAQTPPTRAEVLAAMKRAATYYHDRVATHGGYVYYYSSDLTQRWAEGIPTVDQIWVQPPGTPTVGLAFLAAWKSTGDEFYLAAARDAAQALLFGQLQSGGWTNAIDFAPAGDRRSAYRDGRGKPKGRNYSTLDDGISQAALEFLMHLDEAAGFQEAKVHEAVGIALDALLAAQFPNGGFPQVWLGPVQPHPVKKAAYPAYDWKTENRIKEYWNLYTLNDGLAGTTAQVLSDAHRIYGDARYLQALRKLGDFLVLAQMPAPQPAWAQQYDYEMRPVWARKFEPPAVTGRESQDVLEVLLKIYDLTQDKKYLQPIPAALAYLEQSVLPDGQLARYYELKTNLPLYMTRNYQLTHDDRDVPDHYGWKTRSHLVRLRQEYAARLNGGKPAATSVVANDQAARVAGLLKSLDAEGRWVTTYAGGPLVGQPKFRPGQQYLDSRAFSDNLTALAGYVDETSE